MSTPAIETHDLRKTYVEGLLRRKRQQALQGRHRCASSGARFLACLAATAPARRRSSRSLLGIIRKTAGEATLLGFPAGDRRGRKLVGYLPENLRVPRHLTGYTALEYYGNLSNVPTSRHPPASAATCWKRSAWPSGPKTPCGPIPRACSSGWAWRRPCCTIPELFILDEPTDGLDPLARSQVRGYLTDLKRQGKTIFLNSHILQEVELICDRVAILDRGILRRVANVAEITKWPRSPRRSPEWGSRRCVWWEYVHSCDGRACRLRRAAARGASGCSRSRTGRSAGVWRTRHCRVAVVLGTGTPGRNPRG